MKVKELIDIIKEEEEEITAIEFENYHGDKVFTLENFDMADVEKGGVLRLQINDEDLEI